MEGIVIGIQLVIILIIFLEVCRFFRRILNLTKEIEDLNERVYSLEEIIKNQSK